MKKKTKKNQYDNPDMGCYLDQGNYNSVELSKGICEIAFGYGWKDKQAKKLCSDRYDKHDNLIELTSEEEETLYACSEDAIDYLNSLETRSFMCWGNDGEAGAFGLWVNLDGAKEDVGFISHEEISDETSPEDASFPPDDYEGEWLHVSDHGNCTLYLRTIDKKDPDSFGDEEIWSIV